MKKPQNKVNLASPVPEPATESAGLVGKSSKNFPAKKRNRNYAKILPSHRAIFKIYEAQGFRKLGHAIRKAGNYSEGVAKRVNVITNSKSWQMLMQEYMPEEHLALRHAEILDKRDTRKETRVDKEGVPVLDASGSQITEDVDDGPNTAAVTKGLELAYRLRGSFSKDEPAPPAANVYNLFYKPEIRAKTKEFEENIKKSLYDEIGRKNKRDVAEEERIKEEHDESERIIDAETED